MDPTWLSPDVAKEIQAPLQGHAGDRTAAQLRAVIEQFQVGTAERYRKRDIDGLPGDETCCNYLVREVCNALGAPMPRMRANTMFDWLLKGHANGTGWEQLGAAWTARALANSGYPVIVAWENPQGPGHVAMVVPSRSELDKDTTFIAQAGAVNFAYGRLEQGFGNRSVAFFAHS